MADDGNVDSVEVNDTATARSNDLAEAIKKLGVKVVAREADNLSVLNGMSFSDAVDLAVSRLLGKPWKEKEDMAKNNTVSVPAFAAVVQADYRWKEKRSATASGSTEIPNKSGALATMSIPDGPFIDTPEGRLVRTHELLHARFTPDIDLFADFLKSMSGAALQVGEDIRLHAIAAEIGAYGDDTYITDETYQKATAQFEEGTPDIVREVHGAKLYMAGYGLPTESGWSTKDLAAFQEKTSLSFSRRSRRILKAWKGMTEKALALPTETAKFETLTRNSHKALQKLISVPPPPPGGGKGKDDDAKSGKQKGPQQKGAPGSSEGDGSGKGEGDQGGQHPDTGPEYKKAAAQAKKDFQNATKSGDINEQKAAEQAYAEAQSAATAIDREFAEFNEGTPVNGWEPAFLRQKHIQQLEQEAQKEEARQWKPTLIPHTSQYKAWKGPAPDEALAKNYTLDPMDRGWHVMKTKLGPLQRNFKAIVRRKGIASPEGPIPKFFSRWFSDKQLFERKGRRLGGTLLIDMSGSMGWSHEQTLKLIEATPAMTIAVYSSVGSFDEGDNADWRLFRSWINHFESSHGRGPSNDEVMSYRREHKIAGGYLTIIAQHGKLVPADYVIHGSGVSDKCAGHGGGNEVDGPALAWLARQAQPRVWFSDGEVTGSGEVSSQQLLNDSRRLQRLGNIVRTTNPKAVERIFTGTQEWRQMERTYAPGAKEE